MRKLTPIRKLSFAMIRRNRTFTIGLFILMITMTMVCALASTLAESVRGSVTDFMEETKMPDAWITTDPVPVSAKDEIAKIQGIQNVVAGLAVPTVVRFSSGKMNSLTLFSIEKDDFRGWYQASKCDLSTEIPNVWVTAYYARKNGVDAGDVISMKTPAGYTDVYVAGTVSLPEAFTCVRRETSWRDSADYGYLYVSRADADRLFGTKGLVNYWVIRMEPGLSVPEQEDTLDRAAAVFKNGTRSVLLFATSTAKSLLMDTLDTIGYICSYFPMLIFFIGLFFMVLFISQIMRDQQKTIGLLSALGHTRLAILGIFIRYALILLIPAAILGLFGGLLSTMAVSGIFRDKYVLPEITCRLDTGKFLLLQLLVAVLSVLSCILSVGEILKIDPAKAFSGGTATIPSPPEFLKKARIDPYVKYGLVSAYRNKRRFLLSVLAVMACIAVSSGALEYYLGYLDAEARTFGKRYTYDYLVGITEGDRSVSEIKEIAGVEKAEAFLSFIDTAQKGEKELSVKVSALSPDAELIVPYTADMEKVPVTDGVVLDEWTAGQIGAAIGDTVMIKDTPLVVTGINRGLIDRTEYISQATAEKMGFDKPDTVAVKLADGYDADTFYRDAAEVTGFEYTTSLSSQHANQSDYTKTVSISIRICMGIAFLMGFILVINIVSVSISERRGEFSILLALGIPEKKFLTVIGVENALVFLLAVLFAIPATWAGADMMNKALATPSQIVEMTGFGTAMATGVGLALLYFVTAIAVAIKKIRDIDPAIAINQDE